MQVPPQAANTLAHVADAANAVGESLTIFPSIVFGCDLIDSGRPGLTGDASPRSPLRGYRATSRKITTMRKSAKIITAVGVAALTFAGGSAFTASNTLPAGSVSGYGQTVSTGATITTISNALLSTDNSKLASVTFTSTTDVTGRTASMTLKSGATPVGSPYTCELGAYTTTMTITCTTANNPVLSTFDTTGLTII